MPRAFKIEKMIDRADSLATKKRGNLFDLPMRLLFVAKTGDSKSTTLGNLLLKEEGYRNDFTAGKIFIFSGSVKGDAKLKTIITELDVPPENVFDGFDKEALEVTYDVMVDDYNELVEDGERDRKLLNSLFVFDDLAFNDSMKASGKENTVRKIFMNGRKFLISCIVISQKYSSVGTVLRENASGLIVGKASNKQVDLIEADHNYLKDKRSFKEMFREATDPAFGKLIINFSKPGLYFNSELKPLV